MPYDFFQSRFAHPGMLANLHLEVLVVESKEVRPGGISQTRGLGMHDHPVTLQVRRFDFLELSIVD